MATSLQIRHSIGLDGPETYGNRKDVPSVNVTANFDELLNY